jgi:beta-lactam-binding protein with PASTA domain
MNFSFITKKPLWQNLLAGVILSITLVGIFLLLLNVLTNHGDYLTVPDVKGMYYDSVTAELEQQGLRWSFKIQFM